MARIPYVSSSDAPPEVAGLLSELTDLGIYRMLANAPSALRPFLVYSGALLGQLQLDPILRELAILRVAALARCEYERVQHEQIAAAVGATPEQIAAASTPGDSADGTIGLVLRFVEETVLERDAGADLTARASSELGPRGTIEPLLVVGHYHGLAMVMNTVALDPDPPLGDKVMESVKNRKL